VGKTQGTSGHLREGSHRLIVVKDSLIFYDADFDIGWQEKKTIELTAEKLQPIGTIGSSVVAKIPSIKNSVVNDSLVNDSAVGAPVIKAPVTIKAIDDYTSIWINRELKGFGNWEGELEAGFYLISTEKDGVESRSTSLWINDQTPQNLELVAPRGSYGMVNIQCNEIGADIYINDKRVGTTPCVIKDLPAGSNCEVRLEKAGFLKAEKTIKVVGNDLTHVKLKLKKK
jgi:hypothetical protein